MKIMHIITGLNVGGAEGMLLRLASAMPKHEQIVVSLTSEGKMAPLFLKNGIQVYALGMKSPLNWLPLWKLWSLIRKTRPDIIQTWLYHADLLGGIVGRTAGVKHIIWNVRNTQIPHKKFSVTGIFVRLAAMTSSWLPEKIICCAHSGLEFHAILGYCRERMTSIPNGYDIKKFPAPQKTKKYYRDEIGLPSDAKIVGVVGRYDPLKGYDIFVKMAGLLAEHDLDNILFLMVGRNVTEANHELQQLMVRFGGKAKFKLMGERHDILQIMSSLDVYCLSSVAEGFPNVVAEAMLMQIPCVVSDVGDVKKLVGETGMVVPSADPAALANALHTMLNMQKEDRINRGLAARQRIIENYAIEKIAAQYESLYEEVKNQ
jgi:glycosyltransferase involved in cell wall biosynthesis